MKRGKKSRLSFLTKAILAGAFIVGCSSPIFAQGGGGGAGGGAGGGGAGGGGGGMSSSSSSGSTAGGSSLFGSTGTGSSGVTSASSGGTSPINKNNPFNAYYANPLAAGYGPNVTLKPANTVNVAASDSLANTRVTGKGLFGVAMIAAATSATSGKGTTGGAGGTSTSTTTNSFTSSIGQKRVPQYVTVLDPSIAIRPPLPMQVQGDLQNTIRSSTFLKTGQNLNVSVTDGQIVVLQGVVESERERQLAEGLVRMTPNVQFVRNEIVVVPPKQ